MSHVGSADHFVSGTIWLPRGRNFEGSRRRNPRFDPTVSRAKPEVLENVTAILGRLILEFLQRLGEASPEEDRALLPVVLVLEEAPELHP